MKYIYLIAVMCVCLSCKNSTNPESIQKNEKAFKESPIEKDVDFIGAAGQSSLLEIHLAQLAQGKALNKKVTQLGKTVESDFINDMQNLKSIALKRSVNLPTSYNETYRKSYQMVAHKHKDHFDRSYVDHVITGYKEKIDRYKKEATEGKDPLIKQWASERLPLLQRRLHEVELISKDLK